MFLEWSHYVLEHLVGPGGRFLEAQYSMRIKLKWLMFGAILLGVIALLAVSHGRPQAVRRANTKLAWMLRPIFASRFSIRSLSLPQNARLEDAQKL